MYSRVSSDYSIMVRHSNRRSTMAPSLGPVSRYVVFCTLLVTLQLSVTAATWPELLTPGFRPPSVPLVVIDPYISVWSNSDYLYDSTPQHWSGPDIGLSGMILIDGRPYRFMNNDTDLAPFSMNQVDLKVYPTQTVYSFEQDGVQLNVTFSTPAYAIPDQLPYLPMTFITYDVAVMDGSNHEVSLYYDNTAEGSVNNVSSEVQWKREDISGATAMKIGSATQTILSRGTDRIDWGYWYLIVDQESGLSTTMANSTSARMAFRSGNKLPLDDTYQPRVCSDNWPVLAAAWDLGTVQYTQVVTKHITIVYDQLDGIKYFGSYLKPYWKHLYGDSVEKMLNENSYTMTKQYCDKADKKIMSELYKVGGSKYTTIASLAWRQAIGGTITVWNDVKGEAWMFMKEISSDGDVSTVDVLYPSSPAFLWWDYRSIQLLVKPILDYAINTTWKYGLYTPYNLSWAPHHLGHWPVCDLLPSKQEQMPVEESGNMILMIAASVYRSPHQNVTWLKPYWKILTLWGDYINASLPDPGDQLCTDDFEGPSPHNVNLAAKGMVALEALSYLLRLDGQNSIAYDYYKIDSNFTKFWKRNASDGSHFRLQYNESDTWSLKYNLLFEKILKLNLFPDSVFKEELDFYFTKMNKYGIPLDNRSNFTKTDWLMWIAALGSDDQFEMIVNSVYKFANETPDRVPFTDWYFTDTGEQVGFTARPVIGGLYAKILLEDSKKNVSLIV